MLLAGILLVVVIVTVVLKAGLLGNAQQNIGLTGTKLAGQTSSQVNGPISFVSSDFVVASVLSVCAEQPLIFYNAEKFQQQITIKNSLGSIVFQQQINPAASVQTTIHSPANYSYYYGSDSNNYATITVQDCTTLLGIEASQQSGSATPTATPTPTTTPTATPNPAFYVELNRPANDSTIDLSEISSFWVNFTPYWTTGSEPTNASLFVEVPGRMSWSLIGSNDSEAFSPVGALANATENGWNFSDVKECDPSMNFTWNVQICNANQCVFANENYTFEKIRDSQKCGLETTSINSPGIYTLTHDTAQVTISSNDTILYCNGYSVNGTGKTTGVYINNSANRNVTLDNCNIFGAEKCIEIGDSQAGVFDGITLNNNLIHDCGDGNYVTAINVLGAGLNNSVITNNVISALAATYPDGITFKGSNTRVESNHVSNVGGALSLTDSINITILNNVFSNTAYSGIWFSNLVNSTISHNLISQSANRGIQVYTSGSNNVIAYNNLSVCGVACIDLANLADSIIEENTASGSSLDGLRGGGTNITLSNNNFSYNGQFGFWTSCQNSLITNNLAYYNREGYRIDASTGNSIINNTGCYNSGFEGGSGFTAVENNTCGINQCYQTNDINPIGLCTPSLSGYSNCTYSCT